MKSSRKCGIVLIVLGLLCLAAAWTLVGRNLLEEREAGESANQVLTALRETMPLTSVEIVSPQEESSLKPESQEQEPSELPDYIVNPEMEMPVTQIEENGYIGVLEIPTLGLSLPVMGEWSYSKLQISPCRYSGSAYSGNFTIAGHNYNTHFGPIGNLSAGDQVIFTDVEGRTFLYEVQTVETLEATAIEDMISDEWDLTLFTCTLSGEARITVRCLKVQ